MPIVTSITTGRGTMTHTSDVLRNETQRVMASIGMLMWRIIRSGLWIRRGLPFRASEIFRLCVSERGFLLRGEGFPFLPSEIFRHVSADRRLPLLASAVLWTAESGCHLPKLASEIFRRCSADFGLPVSDAESFRRVASEGNLPLFASEIFSRLSSDGVPPSPLWVRL